MDITELMETSDLIKQRSNTHGSFTSKALFIQILKAKLRGDFSLVKHDVVLLEAMDNILQKLGRIVIGDFYFKDHWDDIAGYSQLAIEYIGSANPINTSNISTYTFETKTQAFTNVLTGFWLKDVEHPETKRLHKLISLITMIIYLKFFDASAWEDLKKFAEEKHVRYS